MTLGIPPLVLRAAGSRITAAIYEQDITDSINYLTNPPNFLGIQTVVQSVPNSNWTAVSLDTHSFDPYGGHSTTVNNSRWTCPLNVPGYYIAAGVVGYAANSTGAREAALAVNGSRLAGSAGLIAPSSGDGGVAVTATREVFLNGGDYIELHTIQDSGGALNTKATAEVASALWLRFSHA